MHAGYEVSQVFLYRDHVDFRKSIDGLKILYWSRNGFCLWYKRLEQDKFAWMKGAGHSSCEISSEELRWLLEGVDIWTSSPHKSLKYISNT